jgi:TrmH family RNA methyltransferase
LRRLHERKGRQQSGTFLAEGPDCVAAALEAAWIREVVARPGHPLAIQAATSGIDLHEADDRVIAAICDAQTPQGIVAECTIPKTTLGHVLNRPGPLVICDGIADPGNLGTIIRTAEAVGAAGVVTTPGSVDLWNPKVVRASAGSIFRLPVAQANAAQQAVEAARASGRVSVALVADAPATVFEILSEHRRSGTDSTNLTWVVGSEAHGVSPEALEATDLRASIPMSPSVESLNAAISVAVCLYAALQAKPGT